MPGVSLAQDASVLVNARGVTRRPMRSNIPSTSIPTLSTSRGTDVLASDGLEVLDSEDCGTLEKWYVLFELRELAKFSARDELLSAGRGLDEGRGRRAIVSSGLDDD